MTDRDTILPAFEKRRMLFVLYPGFELLDLAGPTSVFAGANEEQGSNFYEIHCVSKHGGSVTSAAGPEVATLGADTLNLSGTDTLLVVGTDRRSLEHAMSDSDLTSWLKVSAPKAGRFGSVCAGAFLLGEAGLLSRRNIATHWAAKDMIRKRYPETKVDEGALYTVDGPLWTSAGMTAAIDMALAMVEADLGPRVKGLVAKRLILYAHRPAQQTQFSSILNAQLQEADSLPDVLRWITTNLDQEISVADMADRAHMSPRHFHRRFSETYGVTPARYLEELRLDHAAQLLKQGISVKGVQAAVGFRSASHFRRAFKKRFGHAPSEISPES